MADAFQGNFAAASLKLNDIVSAFRINATLPTASIDQINTYNSLVNGFEDSINALLVNPAELAQNLKEIFSEFTKLYETPTEQTTGLSLFFDFGDDDVIINPSTAGLIQRKRNNDILNNSMKSMALANAYVSSAQIEFTTVDDVENTANILESAFQSIKSSVGLGDANLTNSTINSIEDLRVTARQFFDDQKVSARQILAVKTPELPARIIAFQYYGNSELGSNIAKLNDDINVSNLKGNIEIFTV